MDHKGLVATRPQNLVEELEGGGPLVAQHAGLAAAGVHQHAQAKRKAALPLEEFDGLGAVVLGQLEVVFGQVFDNLPRLVPNGGKQVDQPDVSGECGRLFGGQALLGGEQSRGGEKG